MKKTVMQLLRGVIFAFAFQILSVVNMLLCHESVITDLSWFFIQLMLCIIALPVYFFVKGKQTRPWLYTLVSAAAFGFATFLCCIILNAALKGWDRLSIYSTERILWDAFGIILALDIIVNIIIKYRRKKVCI